MSLTSNWSNKHQANCVPFYIFDKAVVGFGSTGDQSQMQLIFSVAARILDSSFHWTPPPQ